MSKVTPLTDGFGAGHLRLLEDGGYRGLGSVGYALGNGWRFEIEGDFLRNGVDQLGRTPFPTDADGHVNRYGVMGNALFDMDIGSRYIFPYLGMGAGYMWTNLNAQFVQPGGPFSFNSDETQARFAWQGIFGSAFPVPGMPGLSLTAEYRFMDITAGAKFAGTETSAAGTATGQIKLGAVFDHSFLVGVRYAFNVAPPPAPPAPTPVAAPAPAPARSYLVFFDWDKATLTDRARQIIKEAADNSTHCPVTRGSRSTATRTPPDHHIQHGIIHAARTGCRCGTGPGRRTAGVNFDPWIRRNASAGGDRSRGTRTAEPARGDHHSVGVVSGVLYERAAPKIVPSAC